MTDARSQRTAIRREVEARAENVVKLLTHEILGNPSDSVDLIADIVKFHVGNWLEEWIDAQLPGPLPAKPIVKMYVTQYLMVLREIKFGLVTGARRQRQEGTRGR